MSNSQVVEVMDKQIESFLYTLNWKDIDNNVSQAVISHDDFF